MLKEGDPAPAFVLADADMDMFDSASLKGKNAVLFFYPKDDTPGCTIEAVEFSDKEDGFCSADCEVLGVSRDDCLSHADFRDKHGLALRLLADTEGEVCRAYGVLQEKHREGETVGRLAIQRSTFIIDREGIVRHAFYGVNPRGHAAEVLKLVRQLCKGK
ncbi:MAG: peroxiredoxin [Rhodocyclaceae bacterium]|nr:peroxiredoxin [Rhodocyclaceae bacterium]